MNCMNDSSFAEPARSIAIKEAEAKQKKIKEALGRYFVQNMDPSCWGNAWADDGYGCQKYSLSFICNDDVTKEEADKLAGLIIMALTGLSPALSARELKLRILESLRTSRITAADTRPRSARRLESIRTRISGRKRNAQSEHEENKRGGVRKEI